MQLMHAALYKRGPKEEVNELPKTSTCVCVCVCVLQKVALAFLYIVDIMPDKIGEQE